MDQSKRENDRRNFIRLANKRVNNALKYIRLIGNLSNASNYYYKDSDVTKIFQALREATDECQKLFENKKKQKESFQLGDEVGDTLDDLI